MKKKRQRERSSRIAVDYRPYLTVDCDVLCVSGTKSVNGLDDGLQAALSVLLRDSHFLSGEVDVHAGTVPVTLKEEERGVEGNGREGWVRDGR